MQELLEIFKNPETINTLTINEKVLVSLYVTLLGMGITFVALIFLWFMTDLQTKIITTINRKPKIKVVDSIVENKNITSENSYTEDEDEIIAVITAAIASISQRSGKKLVIKNIVRESDHSPVWNREGLVSQINNRL
jgi:sodium pump decarboxylase gamma subunit